MTARPPNPEKPPLSEQEVAELLNARDAGDPEALEVLDRFIEQCQSEADREIESDPSCTHRAVIKLNIKIARLYLKVNRKKDEAGEILQDALYMIAHDPSVQDMETEIRELIEKL